MNNETNNNVNNPGMPAGISFVQSGTPTSAPPSNVPPQQPVSQMPGPVPAPMAPTPAPTPVVPEPVKPVTPAAPEPVAPQPVTPAHLNFVQSGAPAPTNPQPMTPPPAINQGPVAPTPMPGTAPMAKPVTPMMPNQPAMGPMPGGMAPGSMPPASGVAPANAAAPTGEEKPPLPIAMIIITVLVVVGVAVFLSLYLTGKINFSGKKSNPQTTVVEKPQNEVTLPNWMNYLLDKNATEIKISRYVDSSNTKTATLTREQLKSLFTKMKDYNVVKYYSSSKTMSNDELQITYILNDAAHTFTMSGEYIEPGEDSGLLNFFNDSSITVEDDGQTSRDSEDYHYILKNFNSSVYDEYLTSETE